MSGPNHSAHSIAFKFFTDDSVPDGEGSEFIAGPAALSGLLRKAPALSPATTRVGRELVHANTTSGYGNFHMKPNGVFYVSDDRAAVVETRAFLKHRPQADLATHAYSVTR